MSARRGLLLVRAGPAAVGLALGQVVEVLDPGTVLSGPRRMEPAVRGVTAVRGRIMPLVHLGALLDGTACPRAPRHGRDPGRGRWPPALPRSGRRGGGPERAGLPGTRRGPTLPWAAAVARTAGGLVPLLDLAALVARISETTSA